MYFSMAYEYVFVMLCKCACDMTIYVCMCYCGANGACVILQCLTPLDYKHNVHAMRSPEWNGTLARYAGLNSFRVYLCDGVP